jgi:hypothetical protein
MAIAHFRRIDRRRSVRVVLTVPLIVQAQTDEFNFKTRSLSVNGHGGLIELDQEVEVGETVLVVNEITGQRANGRVASVRRERDLRTKFVGIEFAPHYPTFWHMSFPRPGARPMRRLWPPQMPA